MWQEHSHPKCPGMWYLTPLISLEVNLKASLLFAPICGWGNRAQRGKTTCPGHIARKCQKTPWAPNLNPKANTFGISKIGFFVVLWRNEQMKNNRKMWRNSKADITDTCAMSWNLGATLCELVPCSHICDVDMHLRCVCICIHVCTRMLPTCVVWVHLVFQ